MLTENDRQSLQRAAVQGDVDAQTLLGLYYFSGGHDGQDYAKAAEWFCKAGEQGNVQAQSKLGLLYLNGQGVSKDKVKAAEWFRKAAQQGDARSQFYMGLLHRDGEGVPQDNAKAAEWFGKAAQQGDTDAQHELNLLSQSSLGTQKTENQLALEEEINVCIRSGLEYYNKKNYDKAIMYLSQAIQLNPNLGFAYYCRNFAYFYKGNLDQAIADLEIAVKLNPENGDYRKTLVAAKEEYDKRKREEEERIRLQNEKNKRDYERALADLPEAKSRINTAQTSTDFAQLSDKFSRIAQVLKSLPSSFGIQQVQIEECENYRKQCEEQKNQHKKDETLSLLNTAKVKIPTMQTADEYGNLAREFASIGEAFKSLPSSFGVQAQIEECENCRKQCMHEVERINNKRKAAIRFRRILAVIIQIVASILSFVFFIDSGIVFNIVILVVGTVFFCRIFFTGKGKGIISMILIILWSAGLILLFSIAIAQDVGKFSTYFLEFIGSYIGRIGLIVAAILAFKSRKEY